MIKKDKPLLDYLQVFEACINSCQSSETRDFFNAQKSSFIGADKKFNELATFSQLDDFENRFAYQADKESKELTISLFEKLKKNKAPSEIYNQIKIISSMCLYCGVNIAGTLDHYLPKAEFPLLVISPNNLIPCCSMCNIQLNSVYCKTNPLIIHPYYEHNTAIYDSQWIFAKIPTNQVFFTKNNGMGLGIEFYTDFSNTAISQTLQTRLQFQFDNLISRPYEILSAEITSSELNALRQKIVLSNKFVYQRYLRHLMQKHNQDINSLHYVVYQSLANSQAFLNRVEAIF